MGLPAMDVGRAVVILATCAVALAACGGASEEDQVVAAIETMQEDMAAGRVEAVCASMTDKPQRQIGSMGHGRIPTTCARDVRELVVGTEVAGPTQGLRRTPKPDIVDVHVDERRDRAVAMLKLAAADAFRVELAKEGGKWKLDDFFGVLAPPPKDLR